MADAGDQTRPPNPLSSEQILQDLQSASQDDVVFTQTPPASKTKVKGLDKEVEGATEDSIKLVSAYNRLKDNHQKELPQILEEIKQHVTDLKAVIPNSDAKSD